MAALRRLGEPAVQWVAGLCLLGAALVPILVLATELLHPEATRTLSQVLGTGRTWALLGETMGMAALVVVGALLVGVPLAVLVALTDLKAPRALLVLHVFPLTLPPLLLALGWFHLFGKTGAVGSPLSSKLLFGRAGLVVTLALAFAPVVTCLTALGLRGIAPSMLEAARTVAKPVRVTLRVALPLAAPAVALSALIVFVLALSEIAVPMFLRTRTYSAKVFARLAGVGHAPAEALALALPLLAIGVALVLLERRAIGRRSYCAMSLRTGARVLIPLGRWCGPLSVAAWLMALASVAPLIALAPVAGLEGLAAVPRWMGSSLGSSLALSALGATAITALGVPLGHALARGRRAARLLDLVAALAFLLPSGVLATGLIGLWNRPATGLVYGSLAILVVGVVARYSVVGIRTMAAAVSQTSAHHEEAAAVFGAGYLRRMLRIVVPMHGRAVAVTWLLAAVFCLRDLDLVIGFYPPGLEPLPVRIFTLEAGGPPEVVAALALVQAMVAAVALAAAAMLLSRRRG